MSRGTNHLPSYWYDEWVKVSAELAISRRLNAKWMDERTEAIIRAERAEKALAGARLMPREKS